MPSEYIVIDKGTGNIWANAYIFANEDGNNMVFYSLQEAEEQLDLCENGAIVGTEDVPDFTPVLLQDILSYLTRFHDAVLAAPPDMREQIRKSVESPRPLIGRIEEWLKAVQEQQQTP